MSEVFEDFVPHVKQKVSLFKSIPYHLILTNQRIIFAQNTKLLRKADQQKLFESVKGKGFKDRMMAVMGQYQHISEKYQAMTPEEILEETSGNFSIPRHQLTKVKTSVGAGYDAQGQPTPGNVTLITNQGKYVFKTESINDGDRAYQSLKRYVKQT